MPIYEYQCEKCEKLLDVLQKLNDPAPEYCPACGAQHTMKKKVSAPSFRLKGGGWYETDFKSDKDKKRNIADAGQGEPGKSGTASDGKASADGGTSTKASTDTD